MEQTKFYHKNFENLPVKEDSKKKEMIIVRADIKLLMELKEGASKAGLDFSEYVRRKLRDGII